MSSKVIEISSIVNNSGCTKIQAFRLKPDRFQGRFELQHQLHNLGCRVDPKPRGTGKQHPKCPSHSMPEASPNSQAGSVTWCLTCTRADNFPQSLSKTDDIS